MTQALRPIVWAVGGSDCSAAAGIQTDLKTLTALGVHGATILTAVTAQNLNACEAVCSISSDLIGSQIDALRGSAKPAVIKTGMLPNAKSVEIVAQLVTQLQVPLICDPVMRTSSGTSLVSESVSRAQYDQLLAVTTLLTPNIPEAETLLGVSLVHDDDIEKGAQSLRSRGCQAVLIKGGHRHHDKWARDFYCDAEQSFWLTSERLPQSARGTGCSFASAVAGALALSYQLADAVVLAKAYVHRAIRLAYQISVDQQRLLHHCPWPIEAVDMPWIEHSVSAANSLDQRTFPVSQPETLGFYLIVERAEQLARLLPYGLKTAQLRIKDLQGDALYKEIKKAIALAASAGAHLFINDHWQIACELGAFGVHLGQEDLAALSLEDLEYIRQHGLHLGISTHSLVEAARAHGVRPSYVALGPIFPTSCKSMKFGPQGFQCLSEWSKLLPYPVIAIGGLKVEHAPQLKQAGAAGAAVISDVMAAENPADRLQQWLTAFM